MSCWCWKLHLVCAVGAIWIPLAALLTPAAEADNTQAPALIREPPLELRFLLGDQHYRDPDLEDLCALAGLHPGHADGRSVSAHRRGGRGAPYLA